MTRLHEFTDKSLALPAEKVAFEKANEWTSDKLAEWNKDCNNCNEVWRHRP